MSKQNKSQRQAALAEGNTSMQDALNEASITTPQEGAAVTEGETAIATTAVEGQTVDLIQEQLGNDVHIDADSKTNFTRVSALVDKAIEALKLGKGVAHEAATQLMIHAYRYNDANIVRLFWQRLPSETMRKQFRDWVEKFSSIHYVKAENGDETFRFKKLTKDIADSQWNFKSMSQENFLDMKMYTEKELRALLVSDETFDKDVQKILDKYEKILKGEKVSETTTYDIRKPEDRKILQTKIRRLRAVLADNFFGEEAEVTETKEAA